MRVPVSWLQDYVSMRMPLEELAEKLSVTSAEIEGIEHRGVPRLPWQSSCFTLRGRSVGA